MRLEGRFYVYAEYCPGDFYWGWWLYATPLPDEGKIEYERYTWLNYDWRIDALRKALGQDMLYDYRGSKHTRMGREFLERCPAGVVCDISDDGRKFAPLIEYSDKLWDLHRQRQEAQLLRWKKAAGGDARYHWFGDDGTGI